MTTPAATASSYCLATSTTRPRLVSVASASSALLPTQLPTRIGRRPLETTRLTVVPGRRVCPPLGEEAMTMPSGTVSEKRRVDFPKAMLASRIRSWAWSSVMSVSLGRS
jgi:hypothetical protein